MTKTAMRKSPARLAGLGTDRVVQYAKPLYPRGVEAARRKAAADGQKLTWTQPMSLKQLAQIFDVHRHTMREWLDQQKICNEQLSARRWRIAVYELPDGLA